MIEAETVGWHHGLSGYKFEQTPGDLPDPGIEPRSPTLQADTLPSEPPGKLQSPCTVILEPKEIKSVTVQHKVAMLCVSFSDGMLLYFPPLLAC